MTQLNGTELRELLQEAVAKDGDFVKEVLGEVLQEFLEMERDSQIGVDKHERDDENRFGTRNGYKDRQLNTRVGTLNLKKPQIREYPFKTMLFDNYQRSEKALLAAIQQMVIDGVSTNKIQKITKKLSGEMSFSKSTVSRLIKELDPMVREWRRRQLKSHYEYMISDACYFYVRENKRVVTRPLLISLGVTPGGHREILGVDMAVTESEDTWREHHRRLKERGVSSVNLTISD
ncbi:MAG: transposase, partial [Elusimicrobiota bacterium]|nr:transposase [Elusimicrobiota bacterium]